MLCNPVVADAAELAGGVNRTLCQNYRDHYDDADQTHPKARPEHVGTSR
jgi:hypothetical protein